MTHKIMSAQEGIDVGIERAIKDYSRNLQKIILHGKDESNIKIIKRALLLNGSEKTL